MSVKKRKSKNLSKEIIEGSFLDKIYEQLTPDNYNKEKLEEKIEETTEQHTIDSPMHHFLNKDPSICPKTGEPMEVVILPGKRRQKVFYNKKSKVVQPMKNIQEE